MVKSKILYILRHAKAEIGSASQDDHDRALVDRGLDAALQTGKYMLRHSIIPDRVLCSTALRARQTWEQVSSAYTIIPPTEHTEKAYLASANELINLIGTTPEEVSSLLLVGHNPGLHQLCLRLAKYGDDALLDEMTMRFPTCTLAGISLGETPWQDIAKADGELKLFVMPKTIDA